MAVASKKVVVPWDQAMDDYVLPEGKYVLKITDARAGQSQNGDPRIEIKYVVMAPKAHKGRTTTIFYNFNGPGLRALRELLQGLGMEVPRKAAALNLSKLEGRMLKCTARVQEGKNGGKFQNLEDIEAYGSAPEPEPESEPEDDEEVADEDVDDLDLDDDEL